MAQNTSLTYEVDIPNREARLRELIIYISDRCASNEKYGATMLNKILWAIDFNSFQRRGKPITGEKYQRLERGPAPCRMIPVRRKMVEDKEIVIRVTSYFGRQQHKVIALREPDLSIFAGDEIALVDEMIDTLCRFSGAQLSEWSHQRAWKTRYDGDLMPYESCYLSDEPITAGDISRTEELARKFNWNA